jgi:predicted MPP superfamily phosphohydrolase
MRIAHITDLHCSKRTSKYDFNDLLKALLDGLKTEHKEKKIDLVFITGDLVDKGGSSYGKDDPFDQVQKTVLDKITAALQLTNDKVVIIPGNHDVRENLDEKPYYLMGLRSNLDVPGINAVIESNLESWQKPEISGLKQFKEFEKRFYDHSCNKETTITHSNFETCFTFTFEKAKIGVAAFNSSWSCSCKLDCDENYKLAFGTSQISRAADKLAETDFKIALFHHPINMGIYSPQEEAEMKAQFAMANFSMLFCGHTHVVKDNFVREPDSSYYLIVTKAGFNNVRETNDQYKSGFTLIDLSYLSDGEIKVSRHYRKYILPTRFDFDVDAASRGMSTLELRPNFIGMNFVNFLKSQNVLFDPERKILFQTMNSISQNYIKSPFPEITDIALKKSIERFLPKVEQFNHVRRNFKINWEVSFFSEGYYKLHQVQSFEILSTKEPLTLTNSLYIDKTLDGKDQSSLRLLTFTIDGEERKNEFVPGIVPLPKEGKFGRERETLVLNTILSDKKCYKIHRETEVINPISIKKAWSFYPVNIIQGYEFSITDKEKRYHIELFGVSSDLYSSSLQPNGEKLKEVKISRPNEIVIPGDEFWLFIGFY